MLRYGPVAQLVRAPACHAGGRRFEPDPGRSSKVLRFIGRSCKQDCRDERQTFSSSPQNFASQIFAGAPLEIRVGGCRDNCTAYASVAQSVEQGTENPRVIGSIPIGGTISCVFFAKNTHPAAVAHLVERHLAKVEVASSSLVGRSKKQWRLVKISFHLYGDVAKW